MVLLKKSGSLASRAIKGGVIRVIDSATGDIAITANNWIEDIKYGFFGTLGATTASAEFDTAVLIDGHKTLKVENIDATGKMTIDTAYAAGSTIPISYQGSAKLIPVKPSTTYKLTFKYITNNRTSLSLGDILEYNSAGTRIVINAGTTVAGTHGETQTSVTITTQATTSGVDLRFGIKEGAIEQLWVGVGSMTLEEVSTLTNAGSTPALFYPRVTAVTSTDNVDQSQTASVGTSNLGNNGSNQREAQSFVPSKKNLTGIILRKGANTGSPTFDVKVSIQADSSGSPSGTDLGTPVVITAAQWDATADNTDYQVNYSLTVTPTGLYWIVYTPSAQGDASNYRKNSISSNTNPYTSGGIKHFNGTAWSALDTSYDYYFKTLYSKNTTNFTVRTDTQTLSYTAPTTDGWANGTVIDTVPLSQVANNGVIPLTLAPGSNNIYYSCCGANIADGTVDPSLQATFAGDYYNIRENLTLLELFMRRND